MVPASVPPVGQAPTVILSAKVAPQRPALATVPVLWRRANVIVSRGTVGRHVMLPALIRPVTTTVFAMIPPLEMEPAPAHQAMSGPRPAAINSVAATVMGCATSQILHACVMLTSLPVSTASSAPLGIGMQPHAHPNVSMELQTVMSATVFPAGEGWTAQSFVPSLQMALATAKESVESRMVSVPVRTGLALPVSVTLSRRARRLTPTPNVMH